MDNLVERLRDPLECPTTRSVFKLCEEAADEIERLTGQVKMRDGIITGGNVALTKAADEIERLQALHLERTKSTHMALTEREAENVRLRHVLDNIKIRGYELGQKEIHDMALEALAAVADESTGQSNE